MVVSFVSTDGALTTTDLADYVEVLANDTLKRVEGVGDTPDLRRRLRHAQHLA